MIMPEHMQPDQFINHQYLEDVGIVFLDWLARSSDQNPIDIDHLWDLFKRRIQGRNPIPNTIAALRIATQEE
jgi:hypothetical protein